MRTFLSILLLSLSFQLPAQVNARCLLCTAEETGGETEGVLFQAPGLAERLDDRQEVIIAASDILWMLPGTRHGAHGGMRVKEIFAATVPDAERYTLLQVQQIINPAKVNEAAYWFLYIET